jgi:dynein heavy chain 1, cytosolic
MGDSLENIDQSIDTQQQSVSIVDHKQFCNYLRKAILILFDDEFGSSSKLEEALDENRGNQDCIKKFLSDPQVQTLYIQKSSTKGELVKL